ncbi:hypothetical protein GCM10023258_33220 [Terrabacter aeriphilus]|uniref:Sigma-70 family RNA polymerase sigma factor n=1 Tax=Terrabacter aeriphilus TaxID=515662 RepID=A0ABP9JIP8_9MICO
MTAVSPPRTRPRSLRSHGATTDTVSPVSPDAHDPDARRHHYAPTPQEARALIATWRRDEDPSSRAQALDTVVRGHLPLAHGLARRYRYRGIEQEELEQVAALALLKAVHRYDLGAATPFGAFATPTITGELRRHFRDHGWLVRPPRALQEQRQEMARLRSDLTARWGREPEDDELAAALGVDIEVLRQVRIADQNLRPASLDAPASSAAS